MGYSYPSMLVLLFSLVTSLLLQSSQSAKVVVDGVSQWQNPHLQIGDSVIFQHKYHYSLYIFRNQKAFTLCNFSQATLLTKPNSTSYIWHISRPGSFYFSFNNGSDITCLQGHKFNVKVSPPPVAPPLPAPHSVSGGIVASSPALPWSFRPHDGAAPSTAPSPSRTAISPVGAYMDGIPFITSNPVVPLPTDEVDTNTIRPLPTSGSRQVLGYSGAGGALSCLILLLQVVSVRFVGLV